MARENDLVENLNLATSKILILHNRSHAINTYDWKIDTKKVINSRFKSFVALGFFCGLQRFGFIIRVGQRFKFVAFFCSTIFQCEKSDKIATDIHYLESIHEQLMMGKNMPQKIFIVGVERKERNRVRGEDANAAFLPRAL